MPRSKYHIAEVEAKRETALRLIQENAATNLVEAAKLVGVPYQTLQSWRNDNPEFKRRWDAAMAAAKTRQVDRWESAMSQRALDVKNPTGVTAGIFLLKSHRAHTYADKPQQLANITVNIDKAQLNLAQASAPAIEALAEPTEDDIE